MHNKFRSHNCGQLNESYAQQKVKISGWVHRLRDHGNLLFVDLRDHYGIVQLVFTDQNLDLKHKASSLTYESVITITGTVVERSKDTVNDTINTGKIEVVCDNYSVESEAEILPFSVNTEHEAPEETRLKYRFLDLRRNKLHQNIMLRSNIISYIRELMQNDGFNEFQTPILTASSPEGARDFLVPSRIHHGKFYALPQAPQQFKQMLMASGFDKYFQIAPCFRDEDARADRSPGEFYQLDMEMSFVEQNEILSIMENLVSKVFKKFSKEKISNIPFTRITYNESIEKYGTDKPDLRNPLKITNVTSIFKKSKFTLFANSIKTGSKVKAIGVNNISTKPRRFFDAMNDFAVSEGAGGLGYIIFDNEGKAKGPIAKFLTKDELDSLKDIINISNNDGVFFICNANQKASAIAGKVRDKLGSDLELIRDEFHFCWVVDFPFFELNDGKIDFSHNPFSMPQENIDDLNQDELLKIKAFQYDLVCNGIELGSGAIRNHKPELMYDLFKIVGYTKEHVEREFGCMIRAFKLGAPPHGGIALGLDRMIMLIASTENIRDVTAFPMNQQAKDLLMDAPSIVSKNQLEELTISVRKKKDI